MATTTTSSSGSISGRFWADTNGNGIQDAGEVGQANATIMLYSVKFDAYGETTSYSKTVTTDANGNYKFNLLSPGSYRVSFSLLPDSKASPANVGTNDTKDSDAIDDAFTYRSAYGWGAQAFTSTLTLKEGENKIRVDGGFVPLTRAYTSGYVWEDMNGDRKRAVDDPGIAGATVRLVHNANRDWEISADEVLATTTTDATGRYEFQIELNGTYQVEFLRPAGAESDAGNPWSQDLELVNGKLLEGIYYSLDQGFSRPGALGGTVWSDADADGVRGSNEGGLSGVKVELYNRFAVGEGGTQFYTEPYLIDEAITDANGNYAFSDTWPSEFMVKFIAPDGTVLTTAESVNVTFKSGETNLSVGAGVFSDTAPVPAGLYQELATTSTLEAFLGADTQRSFTAAMSPEAETSDISQAAEMLRKLSAAMATETATA